MGRRWLILQHKILHTPKIRRHPIIIFMHTTEKEFKIPYWIFLAVAGAYCAFWLIVYCGFIADNQDAWAHRGQFGDMFGAINALFSGLAFAGLIITILLQRKELSAQQGELRQNTQALRDQKEVFDAQKDEMISQGKQMVIQSQALETQLKILDSQNTTSKRQRFEGTFFKMVDIHLSNLRALHYVSPGTSQVAGLRVIYKFIDLLMSQYEPYKGEGHFDSRQNIYNDIIVNRLFTHVVSPYLRSLAACYEQIETTEWTDESAKNRYVRNLKAYVSSIEAEFLLYHFHFCNRNKLNEQEVNTIGNFLEVSGLHAETKEYLKAKRNLVI